MVSIDQDTAITRHILLVKRSLTSYSLSELQQNGSESDLVLQIQLAVLATPVMNEGLESIKLFVSGLHECKL